MHKEMNLLKTKYIFDKKIAFAEHCHMWLQERQIIVITDKVVGKYHLQTLLDQLVIYQPEFIQLFAHGELCKTWDTVQAILSQLIELSADRNTLLIALGGGVIGDIVGLVASLYMRGISWLNIPTSLLAQVDAGIGGKTGINFKQFKNIIGSFYPPLAGYIAADYLATLPERHYNAAIAEVIKIAMISDFAFFEWLEQQSDQIRARQEKSVNEMIRWSVQLKCNIVERDLHETAPLGRVVLNFGHTFGHAIESLNAFRHYLHGEAVALGMKLESRLAQRLGWLEESAVDRLCYLLDSFNLPTQCDKLDIDGLVPFLRCDKKKIGAKLRWVLPHGIGQANIKEGVSLSLLKEVVHHYA